MGEMTMVIKVALYDSEEQESGLTSSSSLDFVLPFPFSAAGGKWIRACRVNSSDREKRLSHPGWVHAWGFSPVCVRICRV